jgi:hypothetical protein
VHAADEVAMAIEDESKEVTAVGEHDDKVENDDKGNENTELDTNKEYQYVEKEDITAQNLAERAGSRFAVDVAKGLSTAALGVGMGVGANEGVRRLRDSSGNEEVSKDGTKIGVSELQKKLEEGEKIHFDNLEYGAIGVTGWIPQLRDIVSSKLGRDIDVKSKAAITGVIISHAIGIALFLWNLAQVLNKKPDDKIGLAYTAVKMSADLALPPLGFILQCGESIVDIFNSVFINNKSSKKNSDLSYSLINGNSNNSYNIETGNSSKNYNKKENGYEHNGNFSVNKIGNSKLYTNEEFDKVEDVENVTKYLKSLDTLDGVIAALKEADVFYDNSLLDKIFLLDGEWKKEDGYSSIAVYVFKESIKKLSLPKIKEVLEKIGIVSSTLDNLKLKNDPIQRISTTSHNINNNNSDSNEQSFEQIHYEIDNNNNNNFNFNFNENYDNNNDNNFENEEIVKNNALYVVEKYLASLGSSNDVVDVLRKAGVFKEDSLNGLEGVTSWPLNKINGDNPVFDEGYVVESIKGLSLEEIKEILGKVGCFVNVEILEKKDKDDSFESNINDDLAENQNVTIVRKYLKSLGNSTSDIRKALLESDALDGDSVGQLEFVFGDDWYNNNISSSNEESLSVSKEMFSESMKNLDLNEIKKVLQELGCFVKTSLDSLKLGVSSKKYQTIPLSYNSMSSNN